MGKDDNKVQAIVNDIKELQERNGSGEDNNSVGDRIDDLDAEQMHELYDRLRKEITIDSTNILSYQKLRESLGLWYSAILFGDILCPSDGEDPVGKRMKAIAMEALLWCPNAVAVQVVLNTEGIKANRMKVFSVVAGSDRHNKKAKEFHDATQKYIREHGTSAQLKIHWRKNQQAQDHNDQIISVKEESGALRSVPQNIASNKLSDHIDELDAPSANVGKGRFFQLLTETCGFKLCDGESENPAYIHFASGLDATIHSEDDAGGIAHMYVIVCRKNSNGDSGLVAVPKGYQGTMHALLNRLVNYAMVVKLDKEQALLRKYKQMFDLIGEPLKKVTRTLIDAQQEVQRVNAILNPPFHVLADAHQVVKDYFTQGRQAGWGEVRWKIYHSPADYELGRSDVGQERLIKNHACGCTLAAAVLGIFGRNAPHNAKESDLFSQFIDAMESGDAAHEELRELLSIILWEEEKEEFYQQLGKAVLRIGADSNSCLTKALIRLKEIVFRAFKADEEKYPICALAVALWESGKDNKFVLKHGDRPVADVIKEDDEVIFGGVSLPFPTYGHLLVFLSSVIAATRSNSVSDNIKVLLKEGCLSLELEGSGQWPLADNTAQLYEMMKRSAELGEPLVRGDLYKPYADIASLCRDGRAHVHGDRWVYVYTDAQGKSRTFSVQLCENSLNIGFQAS